MRLMSLAAQKFVADIATDAFQYCKIRQQSKKNLGKVFDIEFLSLFKRNLKINCFEFYSNVTRQSLT